MTEEEVKGIGYVIAQSTAEKRARALNVVLSLLGDGFEARDYDMRHLSPGRTDGEILSEGGDFDERRYVWDERASRWLGFRRPWKALRKDKQEFLDALSEGRLICTPARLALANHIRNYPQCECRACGANEV